MKQAKKGLCQKCGIYFYIHEHHILPKSKFGQKGEVALLCPNCHTHFHEYSKKYIKNPYDENEARKIWNIWFTSVSVIVSMLILGFFLF